MWVLQQWDLWRRLQEAVALTQYRLQGSNLSGVMGFARGRINKSDSLHFSSYNPDYISFYPALKMVIYYRIRDSHSEAYTDTITLCN